MLVREVMTSPVITVRRTDTVRRAVQVLYDHTITAVPVLDDAGRLAGIVSEMDLLTGEFQPDPRAQERPLLELYTPPPAHVADVMTEDVVTVTEATDVTQVIAYMVGKRIKSVPVVRGDVVVGIVSRRDLMAMLARPDDSLREEVLAVLRDNYPFGPHWQVTVTGGVAELHGHAGEHVDHIADLLARTVPGIVRVRHYQ
ncbi:CBS domain-containing protein [Streptosporangiaceae bacterium NEAU-GS5]|nr:CBS domain-containing protein [Streptosporangiaceae bacterium NEAU-GS5]